MFKLYYLRVSVTSNLTWFNSDGERESEKREGWGTRLIVAFKTIV